MSEKIPSMGYNHETGEAKKFELDKGEKLPKGWHDAPKPEHHPNYNPATAQKPDAPAPEEPEDHDRPIRRKK